MKEVDLQVFLIP